MDMSFEYVLFISKEFCNNITDCIIIQIILFSYKNGAVYFISSVAASNSKKIDTICH